MQTVLYNSIYLHPLEQISSSCACMQSASPVYLQLLSKTNHHLSVNNIARTLYKSQSHSHSLSLSSQLPYPKYPWSTSYKIFKPILMFLSFFVGQTGLTPTLTLPWNHPNSSSVCQQTYCMCESEYMCEIQFYDKRYLYPLTCLCLRPLPLTTFQSVISKAEWHVRLDKGIKVKMIKTQTVFFGCFSSLFVHTCD